MGNIGAMYVVSGSVKDVLQALEKELGFITKYFTLKAKNITGFTTSITLSGGSNDYEEVTFTHNLGYEPAYEIYMEDHDGRMISIPGRSNDLASPSCGTVETVTNNAITVRFGYYGGATHAHQHTRAVLCIVYVEEEIQ